jgi:uncharacterized protein YjbJ (UPF0337 family)
MRIPRLDVTDARDLGDKAVGLGKEIAGRLFDEDKLVTSGEAQQNKGSEHIKARREKANAQRHASNARTQRSRQRSAQRERTGG